MYGFQTIAFLKDYNFLYLISERVQRLNYPGRLTSDMTFIEQSGNIGLLIAYVISWFIASKRNWNWINSVIVFAVAFLLENFVVLKSVALHKAFLNPGGLFKVYAFWAHLACGLGLLAIGCVLFFWKRIIIFIDKQNLPPAPELIKGSMAARKAGRTASKAK
jgi:hypothetical protein